jgi:UMF1 family MFS transporter
MYDWAISVYNLVITSSIFPIYFAAVVVNEQGGNIIKFAGINIKNSVLYSYSLSFAFLLAAFVSPFLTSIADYSGKRKLFMHFFCILGGLACCTLYFFDTNTISLGVISFIVAGIGYSGSFVFYNSYLPIIATEDKFDSISARGFAMGYIGSVILLIFNLLMILQPQYFGGISSGLASRISFLMVGVWWILFAQYTFYHLPKDSQSKAKSSKWLLNGIKELQKVWSEIQNSPYLKKFLIAFFLYNLGVQTTMYIATIFAESELHLPSSNLIATVLILQLIAIPGAMLTSKLSSKIGNINTIMIEIIVWIGICIGAYFVANGNQFYALAGVVGLVMGGIQSLSRSTYSKLIPQNTHDTASYFSFYEMTDKISLVSGTFVYGFVESITGNARNSVLTIGIFFIMSLLVLFIGLKSKPNN